MSFFNSIFFLILYFSSLVDIMQTSIFWSLFYWVLFPLRPKGQLKRCYCLHGKIGTKPRLNEISIEFHQQLFVRTTC